MKKILFLILFLFNCSSLITTDKNALKNEIDTCPGNKSGVVVLHNDDMLAFKCSHVLVDRKGIYIIGEGINQEFLWRNVRTVHIYNSCMQDDYIDKLKKLDKKK